MKCPHCGKDIHPILDEDDEDDYEDDDDEEEDEESRATPSEILHNEMLNILDRHQTDWHHVLEEGGKLLWDTVDGFLNDTHTVFVAPDIPVKRRIAKSTKIHDERKGKCHNIFIGNHIYDVDYISQALAKIGAIADGTPPKLYWCSKDSKHEKDALLGIGFYRGTAQTIICPRVEDWHD